MQIDTVIIGAGPVGLYTAFRLGLKGISSCIIENLPHIGGQCFNLYSDKAIYDLPGITNISGQHLIDNIKNQIDSTNQSEIWLNTSVIDVYKTEDNNLIIKTNSNKIITAKYLIVCTGGGSFEPKRPPIEGIENINKNLVFYSINNLQSMLSNDIMILGGGDSALDWGIQLQNICQSITIVHRSERFRANEMLVQQAKKSEKINFIMNAQIGKLYQINSNKVIAVLENTGFGSKEIEFDKILICFGMASVSNNFDQWSIDLNTMNNKIVVNPTYFETNEESVFAAGDCSYFEFKQHNLITGFFQALQITNKISNKLKLGTSTSI